MIESLQHLLEGFGTATTLYNLSYCLVGAIVGTLVGVLPGTRAHCGHRPSHPGHIQPQSHLGHHHARRHLLRGDVRGVHHLHPPECPGETASVITCIDGYQMAQKGRAGPALAICAIGSFIAGTIGIFGLVFLAPPLAEAALAFGPPEFFSLMVFGFIVLSNVTGTSLIKSLMMAVIGLIIGTIGLDPVTGVARFTFDSADLSGRDRIRGRGHRALRNRRGPGSTWRSLPELLEGRVLVPRFRDFTRLPGSQEIHQSHPARHRHRLRGGAGPRPAPVIATYSSYMIERRISDTPRGIRQRGDRGGGGP